MIHGTRPQTPTNPAAAFDERVRLISVPHWGARKTLRGAAAVLIAANAVMREVGRHEAGILHLHSSHAGLLGRMLPQPAGWSRLYTPHGYAFLYEGLPRPVRVAAFVLEAATARRATTLAVSRTEAAIANRLRPRRVIVVQNGVEVPPDEPEPANGGFVVVSVGRAVFHRRPDLFREVAESIQRELPASFRWIGDGEAGAELTAAGVEVTGWAEPDDVRRAIASAHVVLHLSAYEGLPLALLEAMAMGRAVVATDIPAIREVVGEAAILVHGSLDAADAVRALYRDGSRRRELGRLARERVERLYRRDQMVSRTLAVYRDLAQQG